LRQIKNTDGLAKLFRKYGREFSIKVHNSEDIHPQQAKNTPEPNEKAEQGHHYPLEQPTTATTDQEKLDASEYFYLGMRALEDRSGHTKIF
jgi:hypothetical protein